jgi:hypothetical protein
MRSPPIPFVLPFGRTSDTIRRLAIPMTRSLRFIFAIVSAASLVLLITVIGLWWLNEAVMLNAARANGRYVALVIQPHMDNVALSSIAPWPHPPILNLNTDSVAVSLVPASEQSQDTRWSALGIRYFSSFGRPLGARGPVAVAVPYWTIGLPAWALAIVLTILPGSWAAGRLARRRHHKRLQSAGSCVHCGHDLKALASCPQCNSAVTPRGGRVTRRRLVIASATLLVLASVGWGALAWRRHVREVAAELKYRPYREKTIPVVDALDLCLADLDHNGTLSDFERHYRTAEGLEKTWADSLTDAERSYHSSSSIRFLIISFSWDADAWHRGDERRARGEASSEAIQLMDIRRYMFLEGKWGRS